MLDYLGIIPHVLILPLHWVVHGVSHNNYDRLSNATLWYNWPCEGASLSDLLPAEKQFFYIKDYERIKVS